MFTSFEKSDLLDKNDLIREGIEEVVAEEDGDPNEKHDISTYAGFSEAFHDDSDNEVLENHLNYLISIEDFYTIAHYTQELLIEAGVTEAKHLDPANPAVALALAEAVNLAAKSIDDRFYRLKPAMIVSAWKMGNRFGYNKGDNTYNLFHPDLGTASFHDPGEEVYRIITGILNEDDPEWNYEWSGITRQELAFQVLNSLRDLKNIEALIEDLIRETTPEPLAGMVMEPRSQGMNTLKTIHGNNNFIPFKLRDLVLQSEKSQLKALFLVCKQYRSDEMPLKAV
jgi:hypothetical protein